MAAVLAESPLSVAPSGTGRFEIGYVTEDGAEHRGRLDEAWLVPLERTLPANLRWLSGYRHPRYGVPPMAAVLRAAFAAPVPLMDGAEAAGAPVAGRGPARCG